VEGLNERTHEMVLMQCLVFSKSLAGMLCAAKVHCFATMHGGIKLLCSWA
jgi:hypothetical protein